FSSRRRHTRSTRDWSSDVCSSDLDRWLRTILVQAAWAASRSKGTYLQAQYRQLARRRGRKRALVAVAHTLLGIIYHMLRDGTTRSEEHTSELQSRVDLVCRLLLEK